MSAETVRTAVNRYLAHLQAIAYRALPSVRSQLSSAVVVVGQVLLQQLRPHHLTTWIDSRPTWSPSSRCNAWVRLRTALKWNKDEGHLATDPMAGWKRPGRYHMSARGPEYVLPRKLSDLIISACRGRWKRFVRALSATGARPGELAYAVAANYSAADKAIVHRGDETTHYVHKTARTRKYGSRDRVIYLDDRTDAVCAAAAVRGGLLLPAARGKAYTRGRIQRKWGRMLEVPKVSSWMRCHGHDKCKVIPYSFRHTWITRAILAGTSSKLVADLCGTSTTMIDRHYGHASHDRAAMRGVFLASI